MALGDWVHTLGDLRVRVVARKSKKMRALALCVLGDLGYWPPRKIGADGVCAGRCKSTRGRALGLCVGMASLWLDCESVLERV